MPFQVVEKYIKTAAIKSTRSRKAFEHLRFSQRVVALHYRSGKHDFAVVVFQPNTLIGMSSMNLGRIGTDAEHG